MLVIVSFIIICCKLAFLFSVALLRENSKKDIIDGHVESILNKTNVESFDGEYELETPLEVIEGSIDELKPKFSLYDDNDIFEYR